MKKTFFLILTTFIVYTVQAQCIDTYDDSFKTKFGITSGVSFISDKSDRGRDSIASGRSRTSGIYIGLFSETRLSKKWSLQNEVLISPFDSFLEIPILIKYHIHEKFEVFLGPKLDIVLDNTSVIPSPEHPINLSLAAGIQYNISERFFAQGRYSKGLTDPRFGLDREGAIDTFKFGVGFKF